MQISKDDIIEKIKLGASQNFQIFKDLFESKKWQQNGIVKGQKPCKMFKTQVDSRVASKGVVQDIEGTLDQFQQIMNDDKYFFILDPQMKEFKTLQKVHKDPTLKMDINYIRFKGIRPVSDRDFVLIEQYIRNENTFYAVTRSCDYSYPEVKGVVRAQCLIGGYYAQKIGENRLKVAYMSDGDIKGSIPGFVKKMVAEMQGEVASRIDKCLNKLRAEKNK